jgi:hypothetical protein
MIKYIKCIAILIVLFFILPLQTIAQANTGKLTGKVTDSSNNQSLFKVSIVVKSSGVGVATITDGSYILSLAPGTYTIRYSYADFATKDVDGIVIKKGESTFLDVSLAPKSDLAAVIVTSVSLKKIENQSALYVKQKQGAAAMDVMSIEVIRRTSATNVAQAMAKMPAANIVDGRFVVVRGLGDQYNQTMLNGVVMSSTESNRNAFALDLIPVAVLDNIAVNKTATPDMPGNFAGGIIQINTKEFPANDFFSVALGTGFSDATIGKDFYASKRYNSEIVGFGAKNRSLPHEFPSPFNRSGGLGQINVLEQQRYLRLVKNTLVPVNYGPSQLNENIQLGYGKTIKLRNSNQFGIVAAIGQRKTELIEENIISKGYNDSLPGTPANLDAYFESTRYRYNATFGGVLNLAYNFGKNKITLKNLFSQILNNTFTERPVAVTNINTSSLGGLPLYGINYVFEQKRIVNSILNGEHRAGKDNGTIIDWNFNLTAINTELPDLTNFLLIKTDSAPVRFRLNANISTIEEALQQNGRVWQTSDDFITGGAFNITTPFKLFGIKQIFKAGVLFQNRKRKVISSTIVYNNLYGTLDSLLDPSHLYTGPNVSTFSGSDERAGSFNAGTNLLASYASFDNKIGKKLRIIWGLRTENYQQFVNIPRPVYFPFFYAYDISLSAIAAKTTFNFLPSANIVYALKPKINLRAAFSRTVARPELKDIAPITQVDYLTYILSQGNPQLKTTAINNYDLKFEYFPASGEIMAFSIFFKQLKDPIEFARNATYTNFISPFNTGDAYVKGIEAEIRKRIDFIPFAQWLKNVTVFGNAALLNAKVANKSILNDNAFNEITEHVLGGQPKYILNAGLSITAFKNTFEASISYNKTGDHIYQFGLLVPRFTANFDNTFIHTRVNPRDMLDISLTQDLFKNKLKLKLSANNILNSSYILYQDNNENGRFDGEIKIKKNFIGPLITTDTEAGIDNTITNIKPQRTYAFTISYTF